MERELKLRINVATEALNRAEKEIKNLEGTMQKSMGAGTKATRTAEQAQQRYTQQTQKTSKSVKEAATGQQAFTGQMQNLTKSVQVALGPLSGVAARITALTALFNRNAASIAAVIAAFTGFTVAMGRAISAGQEFQREMLGIQSVIDSTGRSSVTSSEQINELARAIGRDTLSSANEARQAMAQLATFRNVSVDAFEQATLAAQGMSVAMGGSMQSNIRRIGRLLNEPTRNLDSLARQGIEFNRVEQEKIELLERSGRLQEAQALILERLATQANLAKEESQGLAGAFDTLGERLNQIFEESAATSTLLESLTEVVERLTERLNNFLENDAAVERLGETFAKVSKAIGNGLIFLIDHFEKIAAVVMGQVLVGIGRALLPVLVSLGPILLAVGQRAAATAIAFTSKATAATAAAAAVNGLALAVRNLMFAFGPLGIAIGGVTLAYQYLTRDTETHMTAAERAIKQAEEEAESRDSLRESIERESNERIASVKTHRLNQQAILDSMNSTANAIRVQMEEIRSSRELSRAGSDVREEYRALQEQLNELNKRRREQQDVVDDLIDGEDDLVSNSREQRQQREQLEEAIIRMTKSYDDEAAAAIEAAKELEVLNSTMESIASLDSIEVLILAKNLNLVAEESEDASAAMDALLNRLEGFKEEAGRTNTQTRDMSRQIDRAKQSFQTLEDQVRSVKAEMRGEPLGFDMRDLRQLEDLNLGELGQIMDVSEARSEAEARRMIAEAMQQQRNELERLQEIQGIMDDPLGGAGQLDTFASNMADLRTQYEQEREMLLSIDSRYADEALRTLENRFKREKDMMRREHADITAIEQELTQMRRNQMDPVERIREEFAERADVIREAYSGEEEMMREHLNNLNELQRLHLDRERELVEQRQQDIIERQMGQHAQLLNNFQDMMEIWGTTAEANMAVVAGALGMMANTARSALGESHTVYKRFAQAQAIMAGAVAANKALAQGPYIGPALAAMIGIQTGAQVAAIEAQNFATGGMVRGPGSGTSDSIPAWLSNGEFVMNADTVNRIGSGNLASMNEGSTPMFAEGGSVNNNDEPQDTGGEGEGGIRIINVMDDSVVEDFMNSSRGERIITNVVQKNNRYSQSIIR